MPTFTYRARDEAGKTVKGTLEAPSREEVAARLHQMGYLVTRVEKGLSSKFDLESLGDWFQTVSFEDIVMFNFQLANMIGSGLPLLLSLKILKTQTERPTFKRIIEKISREVEGGMSFSEALTLHPRIFSKLFINMVRAGEATGHLDAVLTRYALYAEYQEDLRQKIKGALFYPAILVAAGVGVILFVVSFVVPQFAAIFAKAKVPLPLPTRILSAVGFGLKHDWFLLLLAASALGAAFTGIRRTEAGRRATDRLFLRVPVIGTLLRKVAISRFARTLATLVESGVPMLESLEIVEEVVGNRVLGQAIQKARMSVEGGEKLAEPLKVSGEFPLDAAQMISVGEETGDLSGMLNKISDFYDRSVGYSVKKLTTLIEPVCLVVMGSIVALIMASMLLPIFDMVKTIHH